MSEPDFEGPEPVPARSSKALNISAIPAELRERRQWVCWREEHRAGKVTKVPYRAGEPGQRASSTDPSSWSLFEDALATAHIGEADGIGYVFAPDDPFAGVDLDGCRNGRGELHPEAAAIVLQLDSYSEWSISGNGLHVLLRAALPGPRRRKGRLEMYDRERYFCMTGDHVAGTPVTIEARQDELEQLYAALFPEPESPTRSAQPVAADDEELLRLAREARNGADFERLWNGDSSGYGSQSEADLALCGALAFWTGPDPARIDSLFRRSGLWRPKWDSRRGETSYGAQTIERALEGRSEFYSPASAARPTSDRGSESTDPRRVGLTYAEMRRAKIPPTNELVSGLVDGGTVGVFAGLPFARKSWAALELAHKVAAGAGQVFGRCEVVRGGPVVFVWQDDSYANELRRLQLYAERHGYSEQLPLRFLLCEGFQLPDDIDALAELVERDQAVLLVGDSLYNMLAPSVKLKDEEVAAVLAQVKAGLCDRTGASAAFVDHAPWPTEGNRGQRRAYGSVFKTAAVRWSIHLEADAKDNTRLHVEARGNNVAGFRRTPATWDEEELEIRLLEVERVDEEALDELVLAYVCEHPGKATTKVAEGLGKRRQNVKESLERLGRLEKVVGKTSAELGTAGTGHYWFPFNHGGFEPSLFDGTAGDGS